ncbi:hypothetical protein AB0N38_33195 [Micromonospora aurantiaca]|uniref:hypothetical protein n=1 Tax=Micromonospora aurantiaca (nom. illeg.) TaxID=47850 RepID=UPI00341A223E
MEIALDLEQVQLLAAVELGRVHMDPRFTRPDFERLPPGAGTRRATGRLKPLKRALLVDLADEPDQYGIRLYRLTRLGEQVLAAAREQAETAAGDALPAGGGHG